MPSHENILHFIWKYKLFNFLNLLTTQQENLQIINIGLHNLDSGPDFYNAKIKISETIWVGNIEIHLKSSDWLKHQHQKDKAYDNVILHVVWENDANIYRTDGTLIPVVELKNKVDSHIIDNYEQLKFNNFWIPCEKQLPFIDDFTKQQCLDRMLLERLEYKSRAIAEIYHQYKGNLEDTFYVILAKSFGFKINTLPFELLAKNLSQIILAKNKNNTLQIEALLFGVAGLLDRNFTDDYPNALKREYQFLKEKYQLNNLDTSLWKFSKTRPDNFPTVRLSQFAALVIQSQHLFSKIIAIENHKDYKTFFTDLPINDYWKKHYVFDKEVESKNINIGESSIDNILLNTVAPLLFFYGTQLGDEKYIDRAINLLENIKPEQNKIIKAFKLLGFNVGNAFDTQAILHLKKYLCDEKKCLNCTIGLKILKT